MDTPLDDRADKDLFLPQPSREPSYTPPSFPITTGYISKKRWTKRITSLPLVGRTARGLRWLLGPYHPTPDEEIPPPQSSLSISFTLGSKRYATPLDAPVVRLVQRCKLHYLLWPFLALWATMFVMLVRQQYFIPGPVLINCDAALYGDWPPDTCGINATDCTPWLEGGTYRCLGGCLDVTLGNPRWIGGEEINGVPYVIGGNDNRYRADSWVCPSAIHSGLISRHLGGCVSLTAFPLDSVQDDFKGSDDNGVLSYPFAPKYPGAYELFAHAASGCLDLHPIITAVNAACLLLVTLFLAPSPPMLFSILLILGYFQMILISDPPDAPPFWQTVFGRLPLVLVAGYFFWRVSFKRTLNAFKGLPVETATWQGMGYWIGMESSTILAKLPVQRLGYGRLSSGGIVTIVVIVIIVLMVVLIQAWQARKYGLLQYYLYRYIILVPILVVLAFIPDYTLRLHHYLLASAAMPVLSLPNRVSLFFQAFALGLFLDGVCRWGPASILQYTASLLGDAAAGTTAPTFIANLSSSESIAWFPITPSLFETGYNGVAVIIDDILRAGNVTSSNFTFGDLDLKGGIDHFFRLAYVINGTSQDYTSPITQFANGTWISDMLGAANGTSS